MADLRPIPSLVLASASPRRLQLLAQLGVVPGAVIAAEVDERPHKGESPRAHAQRCADAKAITAALQMPDKLILAGDTVVAVGQRILGKTEDPQVAHGFLTLLSGRRHRVYTALTLRAPDGRCWRRLSETMVQFKRLHADEVAAYLATDEWRGKAGAYALQGRAAGFISQISGSPSGVIGLPLYETQTLLTAAGCL